MKKYNLSVDQLKNVLLILKNNNRLFLNIINFIYSKI